jgi:hypothetical protein
MSCAAISECAGGWLPGYNASKDETRDNVYADAPRVGSDKKGGMTESLKITRPLALNADSQSVS